MDYRIGVCVKNAHVVVSACSSEETFYKCKMPVSFSEIKEVNVAMLRSMVRCAVQQLIDHLKNKKHVRRYQAVLFKPSDPVLWRLLFGSANQESWHFQWDDDNTMTVRKYPSVLPTQMYSAIVVKETVRLDLCPSLVDEFNAIPAPKPLMSRHFTRDLEHANSLRMWDAATRANAATRAAPKRKAASSSVGTHPELVHGRRKRLR